MPCAAVKPLGLLKEQIKRGWEEFSSGTVYATPNPPSRAWFSPLSREEDWANCTPFLAPPPALTPMTGSQWRAQEDTQQGKQPLQCQSVFNLGCSVKAWGLGMEGPKQEEEKYKMGWQESKNWKSKKEKKKKEISSNHRLHLPEKEETKGSNLN